MISRWAGLLTNRGRRQPQATNSQPSTGSPIAVGTPVQPTVLGEKVVSLPMGHPPERYINSQAVEFEKVHLVDPNSDGSVKEKTVYRL